MTEKEFQQQVIDFAKLNGWLVYFTWSSKHSPAGFPDLVMVHPDKYKVVFVELKVGKNKLTASQEDWIDALCDAGEYVYVWYPEDWPQIEQILIR